MATCKKWQQVIFAYTRGETKPERRSGKRIVAGTAFRLEFQVH